MIKKLTNEDKNNVLKLLNKEPAYNLFAIGDIEVYGCEGDVVEAWAESENKEIVGVLLRYNDAVLIYYSHDDVNPEGFVETIKNIPHEINMISGKDKTIERTQKYFDYSEYKKLFFCKLDKPIDKSRVENINVEIAVPQDAQKICDLQNSIKEFSSKAVVERVAKNIANGFSRVYCIKDDNGDVISMALTSAENSTAAMIVGVCTHVDYRKLGYMRKVMTKLCYDLQQENKLTCLFYDNKDAGRIYHSIGFETMGMWHMLDMKK